MKVDVGRFNRNVDIAEAYGLPLKSGIPVVAVLAADGSGRKSGRCTTRCPASGMGSHATTGQAEDIETAVAEFVQAHSTA